MVEVALFNPEREIARSFLIYERFLFSGPSTFSVWFTFFPTLLGG